MENQGVITREQLLEKFKQVEQRIEEIKSTEGQPYFTAAVFIPKFGFLPEIETLKDLVSARAFVESQLGVDVVGLDLTEEELKEIQTNKYLNISRKTWDEEFKRKLQEIRNQVELDKLKADRKLLNKHLNEDDKFNIDMSKLNFK